MTTRFTIGDHDKNYFDEIREQTPTGGFMGEREGMGLYGSREFWETDRGKYKIKRGFFFSFEVGEIQQVYRLMRRNIERAKLVMLEKEERMAIVISLKTDEEDGSSDKWGVAFR